MRTAGSHRPTPGDRLQRARRLQQMVAFQRRILRHMVLPHVVGDLVPAAHRRSQRLWIQFADPPRHEERRLDAMRVEQLDQPPDADPAAELALGKLHRRFVQQPPQQHRVEIGSEVHRDPRVRGPGQIGDALMARIVALRRCAQVRNLLFELAGHRRDVPLGNSSDLTTSVDFTLARTAQSILQRTRGTRCARVSNHPS